MSNKKLEFKTISKEEIGGKQIKCIQVYRKDKKYITLEQVSNLFNDLKNKGINSNKIMIRGLNDLRFTTLKGKNQEDIDFDDDYYQNKVLDKKKFTNFIQLQIYVYS
jgi:hypothetical protein